MILWPSPSLAFRLSMSTNRQYCHYTHCRMNATPPQWTLVSRRALFSWKTSFETNRSLFAASNCSNGFPIISRPFFISLSARFRWLPFNCVTETRLVITDGALSVHTKLSPHRHGSHMAHMSSSMANFGV